MRVRRIHARLGRQAMPVRQCPRCPRVFLTERGRRTHYTKAHVTMNASKNRGTYAESRVVEYLRTRGWPYVERRALSGQRDRGDIAGIVNVVLEVKSAKQLNLSGWLAEVRAEAANDGERSLGFAWIKRRGTSDPGEWYVLTDGATLTKLLKEAGY